MTFYDKPSSPLTPSQAVNDRRWLFTKGGIEKKNITHFSLILEMTYTTLLLTFEALRLPRYDVI